MNRVFSLEIFTKKNNVSRIEAHLPRIEVKQLLHHRSVSEAQLLLPAVFSLCPYAQGAAAWAALTRAQGKTFPEKEHATRAAVVALESIQETLRSFVFSVPESLKPAPMVNQFARVWRESNAALLSIQQTLRKNHTPLSPEEIAQHPILEQWDNFCANYMFGVSSRAWLNQAKEPCFAEMPETAVLQWIRQMLQEAPLMGDIALHPLPIASFCEGKLPWRALIASPYDVGVHRRVVNHPVMYRLFERYGIGLISRFMGRLFDVAQTLIALSEGKSLVHWIRAYPFAGDFSVSIVETARGLLLHRAQIQDHKITSYHICAPTDWNLNKHGALSTLLKKSALHQEKLYRHATWLVQALDPCVAFTIELKEGEHRA